MAIEYVSTNGGPRGSGTFTRLLNWPEANYVVTAIPPFDGFLCLECIRLHNSGAKGGGSFFLIQVKGGNYDTHCMGFSKPTHGYSKRCPTNREILCRRGIR